MKRGLSWSLREFLTWEHKGKGKLGITHPPWAFGVNSGCVLATIHLFFIGKLIHELIDGLRSFFFFFFFF